MANQSILAAFERMWQHVVTALSNKSDISHTHNDIYYTTEEMDTKLSAKSDTSHTHDSAYDAKGTADSVVSTHNTSTSAHSDIRLLITDLTTKLNNFLDVDDATTDQLSEVLTLIENNKGTLESLTTSKVNVSDIIDNLTTSNASKVLSANQGVIIKALIDELAEVVDGKAASTHSHTITANASDDDVVVLTGTNGTNGVTYSASHANSGVTAGTYRSVTVNAKGHVTAGTNPTTLSGYGITDVYTKAEVDSIASSKAGVDHTHTAITEAQIDEICVDFASTEAVNASLDEIDALLGE